MGYDLMDVFVKIGADTKELESGLGKAKDMASGIGSTIGNGVSAGFKLVGTAVTAATTAVGAFAASSVKVGASFDSSMSQVAATLGVTTDEVSELRDFALEMGSTTAFSATQAADALNYMALAGYDADQSMEMLPTVLNLAAAGNMDLARASDMVTDAQSALGLSFDETTDMVDMMAKASSKSNTSVQQLGDAILTIGGTANIMSGGTNELATSLGILADNGIKGSEGGTKLRNVLLSLSAPTDKARALLDGFGIATADAEGNMRPLQEIMGELGDSMDGLGTAERAEIINTIFNKQDIAAVNALLNTSAERWDELSAAIDDSTGAAEQMANTQLDNLAGDITMFKSALEGAQIVLSDALTPQLREFVQFGTEGISQITEGFKKGGLDGAMDAFGKVLSDGVKMVAESIPEWVDAGIQVLEALGGAVVDNADVIWDAVMEIGSELADKALEILGNISDGLEDFEWSETAQNIVDWLSNAFSGDTASSLLEVGLNIVTQIATGLLEAAPVFLDAIAEWMATLADGINEVDYGEVAQGIIDGISGYLTGDSMSNFLEAGLALTESIIGAILEAAPVLAEGALDIIAALAEGLSEAVTSLSDTAVSIITSLSGFLSDNASKIMDTGTDIILALIDGIINAIPTLVENIPTIIDNIVSAFEQAIPKLSEMGVKIIAELVRGVVNTAPTLVDSFPSILESIYNIWSTFNWLNIGRLVIEGILSGVNELFGDIPSKLQDIANDAIDKVVNSEWVQSGRKTIELLVNGIQELFNDPVNKVKEIADAIIEKWKGIDWLSLGTHLVEGIWSGISNGYDWITQRISEWAGNVFDWFKRAFKIESPSKLMREGVGKYIGQGVALGIMDSIPDVEESMSEMADIVANTDMGADLLGTVGDESAFSSGGGLSRDEITVDDMVDAFVLALEKYGLTVEVDNREFGRIVRKEVMA